MSWRDRKSVETYSAQEIGERLAEELPEWRFEDGHIRRLYAVTGWKSALMVTNTVGHLAEVAFHHPDLAVSWGSVEVSLMTHSAGGVTNKDFELARKIESVVLWQPAEEGGALEGTPKDPKYAYVNYD